MAMLRACILRFCFQGDVHGDLKWYEHLAHWLEFLSHCNSAFLCEIRDTRPNAVLGSARPVAAWLLYGRGGTHENGAPPPPPLSRTHKPEALLMNSCPPSADSTSGGGGGWVLSAFGRFNERGGCCPPSADSTSGGGGGGGGVLSAFGRFNERGGGGGR